MFLGLYCGLGMRSSPEGDRKALWSRPQARNPCINTRKKYGEVTNPIARKGQGRNSLAESRGRASGEVVIMENWLLNLIWVYLLAVNTLAFSLMGIDKRRAKRGRGGLRKGRCFCRWCCSAASEERWGCSASIIKRSIGIFAMASRSCWWCSCCCWEQGAYLLLR